MTDNEKMVYLYELQRDRFAKNKFTKNQAEACEKIIDLLKQCASPEEAMEKMKNSPLYLAQSEALMKDRFQTLLQAAKEMDMPKLAEVYEKKIQDIESDINEMYATGYEQTALKEKMKYLLPIESLRNLHVEFIQLLALHAFSDETDKNNVLNSIKENTKAFVGLDMQDIANKQYVKDMFMETDSGYNRFIQEVAAIDSFSFDAVTKFVDEQLNAQWDEFLAKKNEIRAVGAEDMKLFKNSLEIAVPPRDSNGKYEFINEEVE